MNSGRVQLPTCEVINLGLTPFRIAQELQEEIAERVGSGLAPPTLLFVEHPHTYTFGSRGDERHLIWDEDEIKQRGIEVHWTDRGGDVTYHGPGQLIGYPILPLGQPSSDGHLPKADYVAYIRDLERMIIRALTTYGIVSGQISGLTGVWIQPDVASRCVHCPPAARRSPSKVASIGVKVDVNGVSRHGFAINVRPDMSYWDGIVACGLADYPQISLADLLSTSPAIQEVIERICTSFQATFNCGEITERPKSSSVGALTRAIRKGLEVDPEVEA